MLSTPNNDSFMLWTHEGGAIDDVSPTATAYPHRGDEASMMKMMTFMIMMTAFMHVVLCHVFLYNSIRSLYCSFRKVSFFYCLVCASSADSQITFGS
jgi:hypothetical protein